MGELKRYIALLGSIYPAAEGAPRSLIRARAVQRVLDRETVETVAVATGLSRYHLANWTEAVQTGGLYEWLGKQEPGSEKIQRAREGIAQMVLGALAEEHFEALAGEVLGSAEFKLEDERVGRTDTDYRLMDATRRPVCRFNVKFHLKRPAPGAIFAA